MKVPNQKLVRSFGGPGLCGFCQTPSMYREVHHVFCKGMGGGGQMDVAINLLPLCLLCHRKFHDGNLRREELMEKIAEREGLTVEWIENEVYRIRRLPKGSQL